MLTSCIQEGLLPCPPTVNLQLTFSYMGDTGDPSMFARRITHVTLMVYDEDEKLVLNRNLNKNELTQYQGTELYLEPGKYRIVCWGNANEYTQLEKCDFFGEGRLHHPNLPGGEKISTNSHLYYGSYSTTVSDEQTVSGDIPFRGAHINVEVYVRGMVTADTPDNLPHIETNNLTPQYNMDMVSTMPYATTYYPETTYNTERNLNQALFQVLNFRDDNPIFINIKNPEGELQCKVNLKEFMADNNISVNGKNEATVALLVEFTELGVIIKVPGWSGNEINPEA